MTRIEILGNGDVRLELSREDGRTDSRHFRAHFGHVVEVRGDKLRRVGADLSYREPALLVRTTLAETVHQAGSMAQASPAAPSTHPTRAEPPPSASAPSTANPPGGFALDPGS